MGHSTIFFLQGALCMCVWASQPACLNWVYQLPLESFEPRYGHICGFVCPLEDLPRGYTCRIWKRLGVIWAGNSGMLQGLGAWSRSKDLGSEWPKPSGPQTLTQPWGRSQPGEEMSGSLNPRVGRTGCPGCGEVLMKTAPLQWQSYPCLDGYTIT